MPQLVVGPMLRYVDDSTATIWVETDEPCDVTVRDAREPTARNRPESTSASGRSYSVPAEDPRGSSAGRRCEQDGTVLGTTSRTFTVHGHHYALVDIEGLTPGTSTPYEVTLNGHPVWPTPDSAFPPSRIRTLDPSTAYRLTVGSCRRNARHDDDAVAELGQDALRAYGQHLAELDEDSWPAALLLLGDQVYADGVSDAMREVIESRRDPKHEPGWEIADFEEYTLLYAFSWSDPTVRWLLSTVPSMMILDDHDIRDDWNISRTWLKRMEAKPWWHRRITAGLGAYWLYQHIGNLAPKERANDPVYAAVRDGNEPGGQDGGDHGAMLDELMARADEERDGRWNFARDIGGTRLIVLDSRGGRVLDPGERLMLGRRQLAWFDDWARGDVDHLLIATSIPYLLPSGIHHLESWNEALCDGVWGRWVARRSERMRQTYDLEHWASFRRSFAAVANIVTDVARGRRGEAPASITFLSGDVHYSYLARTTEPTGASPIHQVVTSPLRNLLPWKIRLACRIASLGIVTVVGGALARAARVPSTPLSWKLVAGNWFANILATLELDQRRARVRWEAPIGPKRRTTYAPGDPAAPTLRVLGSATLAE